MCVKCDYKLKYKQGKKFTSYIPLHGHSTYSQGDGVTKIEDIMKRASEVGANLQLDLVPVDFYLKEAWEERWDEFAVTGGEDYELLFTFNADSLNRLNSTEDLDFTVIGEITGEKGVVRILDSDGAQVDFNSGGWDHFQHPG